MDQCSLFDVGCWTNWLFQAFSNFFLWIVESLLGAVAFILESIPVPAFMQSAGTLALPDSVLYFTTLLQMHYGAGIVATAWTLRFLIRRIPIIG